jgi:DNA-binding NarL/FixJ family response regulator
MSTVISAVPSAEHRAGEAIAAQRADSGILLFASSKELIYMNREASNLSDHINRTRQGHLAAGILPPEAMQICDEILQRLRKQFERKDWEQFEVRRMVGSPDQPVLLRGFGLPDDAGASHSRVLIIMERISLRVGLRVQSAISPFHLTERETQVLQQLAKGLTNKEIANALGIAQHTVKEHIKRLMEKMETTTRTGLLSRILHAFSDHASPEPVF